ncbi:hypothetical protein LJC35_06580 [Parabacteroides sp. OttesenSCG-928-N08]|nr:hypothetical protein [Parabacteroides sp. OttesenSCG-928-N08]
MDNTEQHIEKDILSLDEAELEDVAGGAGVASEEEEETDSNGWVYL